jgi:hypothetical protein
MVTLHKLIQEFAPNNHRLLIFSQSWRMLDIIQRILLNRQCRHMRMDGTTRAAERQDAINRFNAPYSLDSVALICTNGLGVGTNFAAADTVIVYDDHGNPQNDIQAAVHCITVGRAKQIVMYHLMTAEGCERATLDCANGTIATADLEILLSRLLTCQLSDTEIALVVPMPSSEVSEQQDEIIEFPAMDPLIAQPMKQRAQGALKYTRKDGYAFVAWDRRKMGGFMSLLLKFGYDRWDQIRTSKIRLIN